MEADYSNFFNQEDQTFYHVSNCVVQNPQILIQGFTKDFGYAFYCTNILAQAKKWALTRKGASIVNKYRYTPNPELQVLSFQEMTEDWLDFLVDCRRDIPHNFDIVKGPMGDDQIWDYVDDLVNGTISRKAFWELAKFKYPTHQIAFCTERSLSYISFKGVIYV